MPRYIDADDNLKTHIDCVWIPTTEKLPEKFESVLLCFKEGNTYTHFHYRVGHFSIHEVKDDNFVITGYKNIWYANNCYYDFDQVIAWMPFPDYEE